MKNHEFADLSIPRYSMVHLPKLKLEGGKIDGQEMVRSVSKLSSQYGIRTIAEKYS